MTTVTNLLLLGLLSAQAQPTLEYELSYDAGAPGMVRVEVRLPEDAPASVLVMPRAIPMGYTDVPYDRYVGNVQAFGGSGESLAVTRESEGPRWRLGDGSIGVRRVRYTVDLEAMEREVLGASDASKARPGYVGLLGYSVFALLEGLEGLPIRLTARGPDEWPVFLTLDPRAPPARGTATAETRDFYGLADSQVALGPELEVLKLEAPVPGSQAFERPLPLFVAQYAERDSDIAVLGALALEALTAVATYFGSVPFPHYTVHVEFLEPRSPEHGYGFSMEHLESCTIFFDTDSVITAETTASARRRHLYNLAHHLAHSWIPKRWAPDGYFPWSWELSPVLDSIWFSEGWGQYAAAAALAGPGGLGDDFRKSLVNGRFRAALENTPDFLDALPLVAVSRIASTRYSQDFRTGRNVFSRGGMMAYEIDQAVRAASDGRKSLRDLLRRLLAESPDEPLDLDRLPGLCQEETGVDIAALYQRWLGPSPLDDP